MANMLARLGVVLGLDSAEFVQGIEAAGKKLEQFSQKAEVYGKVGITAMVAATAAAIKYADEISDTAKANDIAVDSVLKLQNALQQSGGEAANAGKLLNSFNSFVDKAATGNFEAQQSFKQMGVTLNDIGKMSIDELFNKVSESLSKIEDPITRNAKAVEVFGKSAKGVDFVGFNEQLERGTELTNEQTQAIIDAGDAWDMLAKRSHDAIVSLTASVGTESKLTIQYIEDIMGKGDLMGEVFKTVFQTVAIVGSDLQFIVAGIASELQHTIDSVKAFWKDGIDGAIRENIRFEKDMQERAARLEEYQAKIMGVGREAPEAPDKPKTDIGRKTKLAVDKEADAQQKVLNKLKEKQAAEKLALDTKQKMFEIDQAGQYLFKEDIQLQKDLYEIQSKRKVMIDEINRAEKITPEQKKQLVQAENDIADAAERQARARAEISKFDRTKTFGQGFSGAMEKFFREAPTQMELGAQAFQSVVSNMDSALTNFVRTGKLSFKDLTRSIIQDLIAIQMRSQMISLFRMAFSSSGVGGVTGPDNVDVGGGWSPAGKAGGGDVTGGMPYYVGERGPELFVPSGNGTIVPSDTLAGAMGGGPSVNYNGPYIANMSAIDTQSAMQFLAKNKQSVWAVYQSANRSVPVTR